MKVVVTKKVEVEIESILIEIEPRYIGDGEDDDMPTDTPMLEGKYWKAKVDVDTGKIENWPQGQEREIFVKVCDAGKYALIDKAGGFIAEIVNGYVPNGIIPGEFGDYMDLKIGADGIIKNWPKNPAFEAFFPAMEE